MGLGFDVPDMPDVKSEGIQELVSRHREIIRLKFETLTDAEIAERVGVSAITVHRVCASPLGKQQLDRLGEFADIDTVALRERIEKFAPKCLSVLEDIVTGESKVLSSKVPLSLRAKTANGILDRAGFTPTRRIEQVGGEGALGREMLMIAAKKSGALTIDVTPIKDSE